MAVALHDWSLRAMSTRPRTDPSPSLRGQFSRVADKRFTDPNVTLDFVPTSGPQRRGTPSRRDSGNQQQHACTPFVFLTDNPHRCPPGLQTRSSGALTIRRQCGRQVVPVARCARAPLRARLAPFAIRLQFRRDRADFVPL